MGTSNSNCSDADPIEFNTEHLKWIEGDTVRLIQIINDSDFFEVSQELKKKLHVTADWLLNYNGPPLEHAFEWHIIPLRTIPSLVFQTHEKEFCLPMAVKSSNKTLYLIVAYVDLGCIRSLHFRVYVWLVMGESTVVLTVSFWDNIDCVLRYIGLQWSKSISPNQVDTIDVILKAMTMGYEEWRITVVGNSKYDEIPDEVTTKPAVTLTTQSHIPDWSNAMRDKEKDRNVIVPVPRTYIVQEDIVEDNTEDQEPKPDRKRPKPINPWHRRNQNRVEQRWEEAKRLHSVYGTTIEYNELNGKKEIMDTYAFSFETCVITSIHEIMNSHNLRMLNTKQEWVKVEPFQSIVKPLKLYDETTTSVIFAYKIDSRKDDEETILYLLTFDIKMVHLHRDRLLDGGFPWNNTKLVEKTKKNSTITRWKIITNKLVDTKRCHKQSEVVTTIEKSNCVPEESVINQTIIDKLSLFNTYGQF